MPSDVGDLAMHAEVGGFFDRFASDFSARNGQLIAERYASPYTAVSSTGRFSVYDTGAGIATYFDGVIDGYADQGISRCRYRDLECKPFGENACLASVTWEMLGSGDEVITSWREAYVLVRSKGSLKIVTSIDHQ